MCASGFRSSTPDGRSMSPAVTSPGPVATRGTSISAASECIRATISLRLRTMSVTSSFTPVIVENSCATPSMRTLVTAAPASDDSRTRRSELPNVEPKPRSSGSIVNEPRLSSTFSAEIWGVWNSSMGFLRVGSQPPGDPRNAVGRAADGLLRVELDDELLLHRRVDLRPLGVAQHLRRKSVVIRLQPRRNGGRQFGRVADRLGRARPSLDRDHVVGANLVRGHVHAPPVDGPVSVQDQLARLPPRSREAEPHEHVVEPALQQAQQVLTRHARLAARLRVVVAELLLQHAVVAAGLLLLPQLKPVLGLLRAAAAVLTRRVRAPLDAALVGEAALALQEELHALAAALLALGSAISRHRLHPPPLARTATVVGLRRDVADAGHLEAGGLEGANRGLAAGARALDEHLDPLEALVDALTRGGVGGDLCGERSGLARALEAGAAGGLPRDHVLVLIGARNDRVVEAGLDVRLAERDVLARLAPAAACGSLLRHLRNHLASEHLRRR